MNRRQFAGIGLAALGTGVIADAEPVAARPFECTDIDRHVEAFRKAMVEADPVTLLTLTDDDLSFGHSNGIVQTKSEFIDSVVSGTEIFRSIELTDRTNRCDGDIGIERHVFTADILLKGEPLYVMLSVLEVWRRAGEHWRLIARQAFQT